MANVIKTVLTYQLDGSTRDFNIPFEYLARKFVVVTLIGVDRKVLTINADYRFATRITISLTKAWGPADGYTTIELRRVTSTTDRLVDFTDGSILRAYDLNVAQIQTMHVAEEARDLTADTIGVNNDGHLDARGRRIVNLANAVDDRDAVPFGQLKTMNQNSWQARNEALQFRNEAETFRNQAEGFKTESGTNAANTKQWRDDAKGFRDEAEQFKNTAGQYATSAGNSAGNAKDSEDEARRIAASIKAAGLIGYITRRSFEKGFNVTTWNEALLWEENGEYYRWDGTIPKNVPAGSTPESSGGVGLGSWVSVGDASLRTMLSSPSGSTLVGYRYKSEDSASVRNVADVLDERVSLWDFHCDPSGNVIQPGVIVDSRQYLQAAIDYLNANGGGTLHIPEGATWYLNSISTEAVAGHSGVIQLKSNVNIKLDGTIKVGAALASLPFQLFVGFDNGDPASSGNLEHCHIYGHGVIDFGGYAFTDTSHLRAGIAMGRSYDCSISGITFRNGDITWAITVGWNGFGKNCVVHHCTFDNLCQTDFNNDHTTVYVGCPYSGVSDCRFYNYSERAKVNACTVELHQNNQWYMDSVISGYTRGVYVVMHGNEAAGAGRYSYDHIVSGIRGNVTGQFCTVGAANENGGGHLSRVLVTGNNIRSPDVDSYKYTSSVFLYVGFTFTGTVDEDTSAIVVEGNNFYAPSTREDSYACFIAANSRGVKLSGNHFDCRRMVQCAGVSVDNFIWDRSNSIGFNHTGLRTGMNLFEMRAASFTNSVLDVALNQQDTSVFSVILFPPECDVSSSKISLDAGFTKNLTNTVVFQGNQQTGANVYVSYPATVSLTSYNTTGAVPFFSDTGYEWVTSAYLLDTVGGSNFSAPGSYSSKANGQLVGLGYADVGEVRTVSARLMLRRGL